MSHNPICLKVTNTRLELFFFCSYKNKMKLDCVKIQRNDKVVHYMYFRPEHINSKADITKETLFIEQGKQVYEKGFDYNGLVTLCNQLELKIEEIDKIRECLLDYVSSREKVVYLVLSSETKSINIALENGL
jgi:hypothetical protein